MLVEPVGSRVGLQKHRDPGRIRHGVVGFARGSRSIRVDRVVQVDVDGRKVRRRPWIFGQEAPVAICHSRTRMGDENTVVNLTTQVFGDTRC